MTLQILQGEMIAAMKAKNKFRKETISSLVAAVKKYGIDNGCRDNIPEEFVNGVLRKEQKTMQEMIDTCPADRVETLNDYHARMKIINEFTPQLIKDENKIDATIVSICNENHLELEKSNRGAIMKAIMPMMKGVYDLNITSKRVTALLK